MALPWATLAGYVVFEALRDLITQEMAGESLEGIVLNVVALIVIVPVSCPAPHWTGIGQRGDCGAIDRNLDVELAVHFGACRPRTERCSWLVVGRPVAALVVCRIRRLVRPGGVEGSRRASARTPCRAVMNAPHLLLDTPRVHKQCQEALLRREQDRLAGIGTYARNCSARYRRNYGTGCPNGWASRPTAGDQPKAADAWQGPPRLLLGLFAGEDWHPDRRGDRHAPVLVRYNDGEPDLSFRGLRVRSLAFEVVVETSCAEQATVVIVETGQDLKVQKRACGAGCTEGAGNRRTAEGKTFEHEPVIERTGNLQHLASARPRSMQCRQVRLIFSSGQSRKGGPGCRGHWAVSGGRARPRG